MDNGHCIIVGIYSQPPLTQTYFDFLKAKVLLEILTSIYPTSTPQPCSTAPQPARVFPPHLRRCPMTASRRCSASTKISPPPMPATPRPPATAIRRRFACPPEASTWCCVSTTPRLPVAGPAVGKRSRRRRSAIWRRATSSTTGAI